MHRMLPAVELHDELPLSAAEVDDVRPDRHLARELDSQETTIAQPRPQPSLGIGLATT
jgi:hypothetical protein